MDFESPVRSEVATAVGQTGFCMGILAMVSLASLCVIESSVLVNPGQTSWFGWVIFIGFMMALNAPSIVLSMWLSARSSAPVRAALALYLILSCCHDIFIAITDSAAPSYVGMALFFLYPIIRPIPFIVLLCMGYAVNLFRTT